MGSHRGGMESLSSMGLSFHATRMENAAQRRDVSHADLLNFERLFDTFDVDQIGYLDAEAIQFLLRCLGIVVEDDNLNHLLELFDTSGNGLIDFEEFVSLMNRIGELDTKLSISKEDEVNHVNKVTTARFTNDRISRWLWDALILFISGYYCFRIALEYYIVPEFGVLSIVIEVMATIVLLLDVGVMANTAYKDTNGTNVVDQKKVLFRYLKTTFVFDLLGAIPIDLLYYAANPDSLWGIRACRTFRFFRIVRVGSTLFLGVSFSGVWTPRYVKFVYKVAPLLRSIFILIIMLNMVVTGWLLVRREVGKEMSYDEALYFILYTITTVGYSDQGIETTVERIYCMILFLCGLVVNGIVISQVSAFLSKADIATERSDKMRETLAVLEHFEIPPEVQSEILSFQSHILEHNLGSSHASLISNLPVSIQESLALFMKIKYISMVPMFSKASQECKMALAQSLVNVVYRPQEFIIVAGEKGREMYFLGHGVANVIHPTGIYLATLRKGNFFGEFALLVEEAHRTASIKALTYCDVFRLEKDSFVQIMTKFPTFRDTMKVEMEERVQQFQKQNNAIIPKKPSSPKKKDDGGEEEGGGGEKGPKRDSNTVADAVDEEKKKLAQNVTPPTQVLNAAEQMDKMLSKEQARDHTAGQEPTLARKRMSMGGSMLGTLFQHQRTGSTLRASHGGAGGQQNSSLTRYPTTQTKYQTATREPPSPKPPNLDVTKLGSSQVQETGSPTLNVAGVGASAASFSSSFNEGNLPSRRERVTFPKINFDLMESAPSASARRRSTTAAGGAAGPVDRATLSSTQLTRPCRSDTFGPVGQSGEEEELSSFDYETSIAIPEDGVLNGLVDVGLNADPAMSGGAVFPRKVSAPTPTQIARQQSRAAARQAMSMARHQNQRPTNYSSQNPFHFGETVTNNSFYGNPAAPISPPVSRSPPSRPPSRRPSAVSPEIIPEPRRFMTKEYEDLLKKMKRLEKLVNQRKEVREPEEEAAASSTRPRIAAAQHDLIDQEMPPDNSISQKSPQLHALDSGSDFGPGSPWMPVATALPTPEPVNPPHPNEIDEPASWL